MNLYQLKTEYQALIDEAYDTGEIDNDKLMQLEGCLEDKAFQYAAAIKNVEAEALCVQGAIDDMQARKKRLDKNAEYLRNGLLSAMVQIEKPEIKFAQFVIKVKSNPESVEVEQAAKIPERFLKRLSITSVDKLALKNALQAGLIVDGACLVRKQRLEIK